MTYMYLCRDVYRNSIQCNGKRPAFFMPFIYTPVSFYMTTLNFKPSENKNFNYITLYGI